MEFVTIHDLSRELNLPERVIRYRLLNLIADQKLKEEEDFRRDDYKDDQHFVWKVNPLSFMRATGLTRTKDAPPVNDAVNEMLTSTERGDNNAANSVNATVTTKDAGAAAPPGTSAATHEAENSLAREMIDLLKDQIKVKDTQLREHGEQLKELNSLNVKLTGTMLQQSQKIENLLRLTGGRDSDNNIVTTAGNRVPQVDNDSGNTPPTSVDEELRHAA